MGAVLGFLMLDASERSGAPSLPANLFRVVVVL
jgi:hypothetical protein